MRKRSSHNKTGIIILAAGKGTRMNHDLPKVLVPVRGVPMILRALSVVEAANFGTKPVVVVGYKKELVKEVLGDRADYAWQRRQLGTGHAVAAAELLLKHIVSDVLVLYGDSPLVRPQTLHRLVSLRKNTKAVMSFVTVTVPNFLGPRHVFYRYGHIVRDHTGRFLQRCVEFKDATRREKAIHEVNSGFYCFEANWLWQSLPKLQRRNASGEYYLTDLLGLAVAEGRSVAPLALKDWREGIGVNTLDEVRIVERLATARHSTSRLYGSTA